MERNRKTRLRVSSRMKSNHACWSLILLLLYYDIDRWTPLGRWNGNFHWPVANDQFYLDLMVGVLLLGAIFSFRSNFRPGMILGTAALGLWAYFHLHAWWLPTFAA